MTEQHHAAPAGDTPGRPGPTVTFSGAHPCRPQCVIAAARALAAADPETQALADEIALIVAERITAAIDVGVCPRCEEPMPERDHGFKPAGTRALPCRCVPICETCSGWIEPVLGVLPVTAWPTSCLKTDDGRIRKVVEAEFTARTKVDHPVVVATVQPTPDGPVLMSEAGAIRPIPRTHPGGWLEHGYDDTQDTQEREA